MPPIEIEKLVYGGDGLSRVDGQVVLTPLVLPGEQVAVNTSRLKKGLLRGRVEEIQQASPHRVEPRCPYFGSCGGCQYQHAGHGYQLEQKQAILLENLKRQGGIDYKGELRTITGEEWFYRNRIQLHFERGESGFHRLGSNELTPIDHCYISSPLLVEAIQKISDLVTKPEWPEFVESVELFSNETELQINVLRTKRPVASRFFDWLKKFLPLAPGPIDYRAAGHNFRISHGAFFQVNRFLIERLVDEVVGERTGQYAVDLYAGVGLFTLTLAERFGKVDAIERSGPALRDLEFNAHRAGLENLSAERGSAEEFLGGIQSRPDFMIADPPRSGLGKDTVRELLRLRPRELAIVSCDPATLARDLKELLSGFQVERMTLVDLFPQTYHLETVVHLKSTDEAAPLAHEEFGQREDDGQGQQ